MTKFIRLSFLTLLIANFYFDSVHAQELPTDPPAEPPITTPPSEPTDPQLPPVLTNIELNETDSKELFDVLNKWKLVVIDRETQAKKIQTTDVDCVENMEGGRQLGCSLWDSLHARDITKRNKNADPLFKVLVKHVPMECEEDSETCMLSAEKMDCTLSDGKYLCSLEALVPQPKKKKGDSK